jgi:hypothetical protein
MTPPRTSHRRVTGARAAVLALFVLSAAGPAPAAAFDVEGGGLPPASRRQPGAQPPLPGVAASTAGGPAAARSGGAVAGMAAEVSRWAKAYNNFVAGAAKVSQLISFACGFWLTFSSPFALVFSAMTFRAQEAFLCAFLIPFGMLMVGMEVPLAAVQRVLQQYFFFVYTRPGRAAFVVHVAVIAWTCKHVSGARRTRVPTRSARPTRPARPARPTHPQRLDVYLTRGACPPPDSRGPAHHLTRGACQPPDSRGLPAVDAALRRLG